MLNANPHLGNEPMNLLTYYLTNSNRIKHDSQFLNETTTIPIKKQTSTTKLGFCITYALFIVNSLCSSGFIVVCVLASQY